MDSPALAYVHMTTDQQTRMFKVLICLVSAMTGTAALLTWVEPASISAADSLGPALAAEQAQHAISADRPVAHGRWRQIDVAICPGLPVLRTHAPTADPYEDRYHFIVGANGTVRTSPFWVEQTPVGERADAVRICVGCEANSTGLPPLQRAALQSLVAELNRCCAPPEGWLPISVHDDSRRDEYRGTLTRAVQLILSEVGFTG